MYISILLALILLFLVIFCVTRTKRCCGCCCKKKNPFVNCKFMELCNYGNILNVIDQNNISPPIVTTCYSQQWQDEKLNDASIIISGYTGNDSIHDILATNSEIGPSYGIAYRAQTDDLFVASYYKRGTRMRMDGITGRDSLGSVYRISNVKTTSSITKFLDFEDFGINVGSFDTSIYNGNDPITTNVHLEALRDSGKVGLGDIDITSNGEYLFITNLFDKNIYKVKITANGSGVVTDYIPSDIRVIENFNVITITDIMNNPPVATPNSLQSSPDIRNSNNIRPFGLKWYEGRLYFGLINTVEFNQNDDPAFTTINEAINVRNELFAYVYSFDGIETSSLSNNLAFSMEYLKESSIDIIFNGINIDSLPQIGNLPQNTSPFMPWTDNLTILPISQNGCINYSQPLLSDIEFIKNGEDITMLLGFRDRTGDTLIQKILPLNPTELISAGDILKAELNGIWTIEQLSNIDLPPVKFFNGETWFGEYGSGQTGDGFYHRETVQGALSVNSLNNQVLSTSLNPLELEELQFLNNNNNTDDTGEFSGGIIKLNISNGEKYKNESIRIYSFSNVDFENYGKGNGLGDIELLETFTSVSYCIGLDICPEYNSKNEILKITPLIKANPPNPGNQIILDSNTCAIIIDNNFNILADSVPFGSSFQLSISQVVFDNLTSISFYEKQNPDHKLVISKSNIVNL